MMNIRGRMTGRGRKGTFAAALLATTIIAGGGFAWAEAGSTNAPPTAPLGLAPVVNQAGFADIAAKVGPAVVNIATVEGVDQTADQDQPNLQQQMPDFPPGSPMGQMFRHFFDGQGQMHRGPAHALGSGFIIDPAGYIVTNNHVVDHAHQIKVTLSDGQSFPAKVIGRDPKTDVALLKIDAGKPVPYVAFGDSAKERIGDWVVAVGNPFGLGGTVTAGIVSAHDRDLNSGPYDDFLQIDAPINPGNSGGPVFNQSGQVVGIDTAIYSPNGGSVGIGFAIPSDVASKVAAQLREHGKVERGWLGVAMQPLTPALASAIGHPGAQGVIVNKVEPNSPASKADLQQGDVITAFNGQAIKDPRDLAMDVANTADGSSAKLTILRNGNESSVDVAIAQQPVQQASRQSDDSDSAPVGMALTSLTQDAQQQLGLGSSVKGAVVAQVTPGSKAEESGVQSGDVIVRVGNQVVTSPSDVVAKIHAAEHDKKEAVPLLVMRDGTTYYLALQLGKA
ncbi:MAG: Do family serine endopeptidase [Acetobacteraceae bacterium]|jgi:serine protease Do